MAEEGVTFVTSAHVGRTVDIRDIRESADAVVLAAGATKPRDLPIEGRCAAEDRTDCLPCIQAWDHTSSLHYPTVMLCAVLAEERA